MASPVLAETPVPLLWQIALDHSASAIVVYQAVRDASDRIVDFRLVMANRQASIYIGLPVEELPGRLVSDLYPGSLGSGLWESTANLLQQGNTYRGEHPYSFERTNFHAWFDLTITPVGDGLHVVFSFLDITARRQTAQQLEEQASLFTNILQTLNGGLVVLEAVRDQTGQVIDLEYLQTSRQVQEDLGLSPDQFANRRLLQFNPALSQSKTWRSCLDVLQTGAPQRYEEELRQNGLERHLDISIVRLTEDRLLLNYTDISEQRKTCCTCRVRRFCLRRCRTTCPMPGPWWSTRACALCLPMATCPPTCFAPRTSAGPSDVG